jgi:hypothetical protein
VIDLVAAGLLISEGSNTIKGPSAAQKQATPAATAAARAINHGGSRSGGAGGADTAAAAEAGAQQENGPKSSNYAELIAGLASVLEDPGLTLVVQDARQVRAT